MKEKYPKEFKTLTEVPVYIQRVHYGRYLKIACNKVIITRRDDPVDYQHERPTIALDKYDNVYTKNNY